MANGYIPAEVERGCDPCRPTRVEQKAFLGGVLGIDVNGERQPISEAGIVDLTFIETDIESAAQRAEQAADEAQTAQQAAENASADAQGSQRSAQTAATAAEIAQEAAETAKTAAQVARAGAETARAGAEAARTAAQTAQTGAQTAQTAAESAATAAAGSATDASASATAAAGSASQAATSATNAASSATAASGSATQASQSATAASSSATAAQTAQTASEAAQTAAEAAQAEAEAAEARIMDTVPDAVANWLDDHVDPATGYVIDDSLTVQNAAADAKAVGGALNGKAGAITDTASGAIASFPDGADAPIKQLTVGIEPQQDLHGYDNPWPAGGGKNKLPLKFYGGVGYNVDAGTVFDTATEYTDGTVSGNKVTFTVGGWGRRCMLSDRLISGESYYISMEVTSANLRFTWYTLDADLKTVRKYEVTGSGTSKTVRNPVTMSETECYIAIYLGSSVQGDISYTEPQIEVGNAKTDFAPYENICPITGWTGATATRTGKNLFDKAHTNMYKGYINTSTNKIVSASNHRIVYIPCKPNTTYTLQKVAVNSGTSDRFYAAWSEDIPTADVQVYDRKGGGSAFVAGELYYLTVTTGATAKYLVCWLSRDTEYNASLQTFQIEVGSTAHDYQAYVGTTYPITWQSDAGTVYGGTLTVNQDGTGTLTVTHYCETTAALAARTWYTATSGGRTYVRARATSLMTEERAAMICSHYKYAGTGTTIYDGEVRNMIGNYYNICFCDTAHYTTEAQFKAYLQAQETAGTPVQLYHLYATPQTYTLTAAEMTTLLGQNNWWADTGDVSVTYRADTKLYIDKKLAALVAALS